MGIGIGSESLDKGASDSATPLAVAGARARTDNGRLRGVVLVVEDNPVNQRVAAAMLKRLGLECELAGDGAQALARVREGGVDLVLMDCQMPVMDGFEATARIRQLPDGRGARLPIVALTANALHGDEQRCLQSGMDAFLAKPFSMAALRDMLARWLEAPSSVAPAGAAQAPPEPPQPTDSAEPPAINPAIMVTLRELDEAGGMELAREVFGAFFQAAGEGLAQVQAAIEAGDAKALGHAAHALKSSAANVGAETLSGCYRELETFARESRMDEARDALGRVRQAHGRAVAQLQELVRTMA